MTRLIKHFLRMEKIQMAQEELAMHSGKSWKTFCSLIFTALVNTPWWNVSCSLYKPLWKATCPLWKASWNACYPFERPGVALVLPWASRSPPLVPQIARLLSAPGFSPTTSIALPVLYTTRKHKYTKVHCKGILEVWGILEYLGMRYVLGTLGKSPNASASLPLMAMMH